MLWLVKQLFLIWLCKHGSPSKSCSNFQKFLDISGTAFLGRLSQTTSLKNSSNISDYGLHTYPMRTHQIILKSNKSEHTISKLTGASVLKQVKHFIWKWRPHTLSHERLILTWRQGDLYCRFSSMLIAFI